MPHSSWVWLLWLEVALVPYFNTSGLRAAQLSSAVVWNAREIHFRLIRLHWTHLLWTKFKISQWYRKRWGARTKCVTLVRWMILSAWAVSGQREQRLKTAAFVGSTSSNVKLKNWVLTVNHMPQTNLARQRSGEKELGVTVKHSTLKHKKLDAFKDGTVTSYDMGRRAKIFFCLCASCFFLFVRVMLFLFVRGRHAFFCLWAS